MVCIWQAVQAEDAIMTQYGQCSLCQIPYFIPVFLQKPTFVNRTYRGGALLGRFLKIDGATDSFCPEDWISSFVEAKNKRYIENEGITRVVYDGEERLITDAVSVSDFGESRESSGVLIKLLDAAERLGIKYKNQYLLKIILSFFKKRYAFAYIIPFLCQPFNPSSHQ